MPHFTLEYSASLDPHVDIASLCENVRAAAAATGVFPLGGIRVRALRCADFAIADGDARNAFVDLTLRMGQGRDAATKKRAGEQVFAALVAALAPAKRSTRLAISFNIYEIDGAFAWKDNAIHDALAQRSA